MLITLPSGLAGEIRGLKGKEAQALADPAMARGARNIKAMLKAKQNAGGRWGIVDALDMQILNIGGVGEKGSRTRAWLEELDVLPLHELLTAMQQMDCGVETAIETECTRCGWQQEIQLP